MAGRRRIWSIGAGLILASMSTIGGSLAGAAQPESDEDVIVSDLGSESSSSGLGTAYGQQVAVAGTAIVVSAHDLDAGAVFVHRPDDDGGFTTTRLEGPDGENFGWRIATNDTGRIAVSSYAAEPGRLGAGAVYVYSPVDDGYDVQQLLPPVEAPPEDMVDREGNYRDFGLAALGADGTVVTRTYVLVDGVESRTVDLFLPGPDGEYQLLESIPTDIRATTFRDGVIAGSRTVRSGAERESAIVAVDALADAYVETEIARVSGIGVPVAFAPDGRLIALDERGTLWTFTETADGSWTSRTLDLDTINPSRAPMSITPGSDGSLTVIGDDDAGRRSLIHRLEPDGEGGYELAGTFQPSQPWRFDLISATSSAGITVGTSLVGSADAADGAAIIFRSPEAGGVPLAGPDACTAVRDGSQVQVEWTDVGADDYVVRRAVDNGPMWWRGVSTGTALLDTDRRGELSYEVVARYDGVMATAVRCRVQTVVPEAPESCSWARTIDTGTDPSTVRVTWTGGAGADATIIERSVDGGNFWWRGRDETGASSFTDSDRSGELEYRVRAKVGTQTSEPVTCSSGSRP